MLVSFLSLNAQKQKPLDSIKEKTTSLKIIGQIIDKDTKVPLEFSTISLHNKQDSLVQSGTITDINGLFSLETNHKAFFLKMEYISYQSLIKQIDLTSSDNLIDLGKIELVPNITMMSQVEVRAEKSSVTMTLDKRIFNVGKDLTSIGGTAEDVLRNIPSVAVDIDGRLNLRGQRNIRILLNGRASSLVSNENLSGLRQIRANQIDRIEVITNPPARYEAEGIAGIINIILKKNQSKGLNGSVDTHFGNNKNAGLGANLNYHKGKFDGFVGLGGWAANRPGSGGFWNEFYDLESPDSTIFSTVSRTHERSTLPKFFKFGADYLLNPKNVLVTSFYYRSSNGINTSNTMYADALGSIENVFLTTERLEDDEEKSSNIAYSLIYKKLFSEAEQGHRLIADFQYENKKETQISSFTEKYFDALNNPLENIDYLQLSDNEEGNRRIGVNLDYIRPFQTGGKFEIGVQSSFREIFNNYQVKEIVNDIENPNTNFTNNFLYEEIINGVYVNVGKKVNKFSIQTGLRLEFSDVNTKLLASNSTNPRQYADWFPSAFLTYNLSDNNAFQLSYSRRIQRPTFADLNPFFTIRDRRNIFKGNPDIEPEYSDGFELGYVRYFEKGSMSSIAYFFSTDNVIKRLQRIDSDMPNVTITQAENLDFKRNYGVEFIYTYSPSKKWRLNGDINIFHSLSQGTYRYEGRDIFVGGASFSMKARTSSKFTLWEKLQTQLTLTYSAPRTTTQGINKSTTALDLAVGVDVFKQNGTVTLGVNDVFNSRRRRSFSEDETFYSEDNFLWQSRTIVLSFHYRFNQQKESNRIYANPLNEEDNEQF